MKTIIPAILLASLTVPAPGLRAGPYDRIVKAESEPANWLTYAGSYKSQRYTQLDQINKQNVDAAEAGLGLPASRRAASSKPRRSSWTA